MVNGPASGGENPLGKEYWERQADDKGYEYDPNKNVPKKTIKVPVGQTQQGEAIKKIEQKFSAKEIAKLIKKAELEQKVMMDHMDRIDVSGTVKEALKTPASDALAKIIANIPAEDMINLQTKSDIIKYIKEHPELKQNIGLDENPQEVVEFTNKEEEKPQIAEKITTEDIPNSKLPWEKEKKEPKPQIAEKIQQEVPKQKYVEPEMSEIEARPEIKKDPVAFGSENDVPDEDKLMQ